MPTPLFRRAAAALAALAALPALASAQIPSAERALVTRWIAAGAPVDAPF